VHLVVYIYYILFSQHNVKIYVTATCFDLKSHLQAYLRTIKLITINFMFYGLWFLDKPEDDLLSRNM